MNIRLPIPEAELERFCVAHGIRRLSLFGSTLRGTAGPNSDIDLLVEFRPGQVPGLFALGAMKTELFELMGGRRVDLRTPNDLSRHFRAEALNTAELHYGS
jgi:predicted nucleotidyltransferase